MVLQWLNYTVPIFAFTYYCTSFMYNLAYPIPFSLFFIFCNFHSMFICIFYDFYWMFIVFMVLKVHMLGLLSHFCIISLSSHIFFLLPIFWHLTPVFWVLLPSYIVLFLTVKVLNALVAYAKLLFYSYLYTFIISY